MLPTQAPAVDVPMILVRSWAGAQPTNTDAMQGQKAPFRSHKNNLN